MSKETIWTGDIIKDFNEKLQKEQDEVKRLRKENERLRDMVEKAVGYGAYDEEYRSEEE